MSRPVPIELSGSGTPPPFSYSTNIIALRFICSLLGSNIHPPDGDNPTMSAKIDGTSFQLYLTYG